VSKEDGMMRQEDTGANGSAISQNGMRGASPEDTSLVLDDELNSAATPFLYLLACVVIAVAAYFLYSLLHG
jgi:hypothetical protein